MTSVLVGMFDSQASASLARERLIEAGFAESAVSLSGNDGMQGSPLTGGESAKTGSSAAPHEGMIARFFHDIFGDERDNDHAMTGHADTYREAFRRGSYGVTVTTNSESDVGKAESILSAAGAVDVDARAQEWRQDGWESERATPETAALPSTMPDSLSAGSEKLREVQEELKVGKRVVSRGGVRIYSRVVEVPVEETVRLREEHAEVERQTVDRPATEADFAAFKEGSVEIRDTAEEAVVSKSARVVGEVEIAKRATERDEVIQDKVRQTKVDVERLDESAADKALGSVSKPV